jgi:hypothetical protein
VMQVDVVADAAAEGAGGVFDELQRHLASNLVRDLDFCSFS